MTKDSLIILSEPSSLAAVCTQKYLLLIYAKSNVVLAWIKEVITMRNQKPSVPLLCCAVLVKCFQKNLQLQWIHRKQYSGPVFYRLVVGQESLLCAKRLK